MGYAVNVAQDGTFDLAAVPEIVVDAFSHRTADIEADLEAHGRSLATASRIAAKMPAPPTRPASWTVTARSGASTFAKPSLSPSIGCA